MRTADDQAPAAQRTLEPGANVYRPGRPTRERAELIAARRERERERYLAGATIAEVGALEGISFATAREDLLRLGVELRSSGAAQRKHGACELCGAPVVARAHYLARGRTRFYCDEHKGGLPQKTSAILTAAERDELLVLLYVIEARTQRYIARRLRVSESIIHRDLRRLGLETDAQRKRPRELRCAKCGTTRMTYDEDARFCSQRCWGLWRWQHGEAIDALIECGVGSRWWKGPTRQRLLGRWAGQEAGKTAGRQGGRMRGYTDEQRDRCRAMRQAGKSWATIATTTGLSTDQVRRAVGAR